MIFLGVVENYVDPLKIDRCQVRIFGKHSDDRSVYPVSDLPWAMNTVKGLINGNWVVIAFLDPEEQKPIILGKIDRLVESLPNFSSGFSDPNGNYPSVAGESSVSRLERNENISGTIIQSKKDNAKTGIQCGDETWDEPQTPYNAEYPKNRVIETGSHVIELDDTEGSERVHIYHKSGTFIEMHPNGDMVEVIRAKKFLIIDGDNNIIIGGNRLETIGGGETKSVAGTSIEKVNIKESESSGNYKITVGGNAEIVASGNVKITGAVINLN